MRGAYRVNARACFVPARTLTSHFPLLREEALKAERVKNELVWQRTVYTGEKLHFIAPGSLLALITFMKFHHECSTQLSSSLLLA
jgi:hypothetical protein